MKPLPSYQDIKSLYPLSLEGKDFIENNRNIVRSILSRKDPRLLGIIGPCSIHDHLSAQEFALQLKELAASVASSFFLVMRVYCEKPRTVSGWKGFLYDPHLNGSHDMQTGIEWTRQLMCTLTDMGVPIATEFLDPLTAFYYEDLVTWGSIGARTVSSQIHRNLASALPMPMGLKNGIAGNISAAVQGVMTASQPHAFMRICPDGKPVMSISSGNLDAHVVLRGGESGPNYDSASIHHALSLLKAEQLVPRVIVDCAHHNCCKQHEQQKSTFQSVIQQILEGNSDIRGCMIESHLHAGSQLLQGGITDLRYGVSITDPCLDWKTTSDLIQSAAEELKWVYNVDKRARLMQSTF